MGRRRRGLSPAERALHTRFAELARSCGGVITVAQCRALGAAEADVRHILRPPRWERRRRGVYALCVGDPPSGPAHLSECAAALAALGGPAVVSHLSAVRVLGLPLPPGRPDSGVVVTRPPGRTAHAPAGVVAHVRGYDSADIVVREGVPVLSGPRLLLDCCEFMDGPSALAVADAALRRRLCTLDELCRRIEKLSGARGVVLARAIAQRADPLAENWFESASRWHLLEAGLPRPRLQVLFRDDAQRIRARVDMLFQDQFTVGEADGRGKYADPAVLYAEKQREDWLRDRGLEVVRWSPAELRTPPSIAAVVDRFHRAFRRAKERRRRPSN